MVKKIIPLRLKTYIKSLEKDIKLNRYYKTIKNDKKFFIFGTPQHGNLGDQAIIEAEATILNDSFKDYKIIEINIIEYYKHFKYLKKYIRNNDLIFINGGGNFGNQYLYDENVRRDIIKNFAENNIIMFPQTMYFTNDIEGENELRKSKEIYNNHNNLTLIAREKVSYELMKRHFYNTNIILTPDIVLYLSKYKKNINREGALFCMRSDVESKFTNDEKNKVLRILKSKYNNVKITDTVIDRDIKKSERESLLENKYDEFRKSKLVVTDRIHGMIFATITGTPCIALSNYNQKVKGTYEWIKNLNYIKFVDNICDIEEYINQLENVKVNEVYDGKKNYNDIIKKIEEYLM